MLDQTTVRFNAIVPNNQYFSIGFAKTMTNCDMIIWQAKQDQSTAIDLYSRGRYTPDIDTIQSYLTSFKYNSTHTEFISDRQLITNDTMDQVIPYNTTFTLCFAYVTSTSRLVEHSYSAWNNFQMKVYYIKPTVNQTTGGNSSNNSSNVTYQPPIFDENAGGLIDIRDEIMGYMRAFYKINHWIHIGSGVIILVQTTTMSLLAFKYYDWKLRDSLHSILGFIVLIATFVIVFLGFFAQQLLLWQKWKYQIISIILGVQSYNKRYERDNYDLGIWNIIVFFTVWAVCEITFQVQKRRIGQYDNIDRVITVQDFKERIRRGHELVILDDMVLDVSQYQFNHPGGRFTISHNIGTDISRYFYGGYQMENYTGKKSTHNHTAIAFTQVNKMIIGILEQQAPQFVASIMSKDEIVRKQTYTYTFGLNNEIKSVQGYYSDLKMIGRHYLVSSLFTPKKKRQYTICNCLSPNVYDQYLRLIKEFESHHKIKSDFKTQIDQSFFQSQQSNEISLTVKTYYVGGVSEDLLTSSPIKNSYQFKGPMGKGLDIQYTGSHIAFSAGTGILTFLDLVAYLIRKNLGLLPPDEDQQTDSHSFKLILFASFRQRGESIGDELCRGLLQISQKLKIHNFEYYVRYSEQIDYSEEFKTDLNSSDFQEDKSSTVKVFMGQKDTKWNRQSIEEVLIKNLSDMSKIWVCGTPRMNEDFDKALEIIMKKLDIDRSTLELL
ncbi:cytochrome b5-like heme steroid binding domain containing protein [Stylonychia lemnae]|uniref:Cytochrome b5-like heme steroid binding domain containing protein n=1 Tax=Stylonychia lemnae TaxID=5949 RepID=A0A077ZU17_STYLE|nr:cytochrome b5-like heme steroid binding domain containing protein [Stylonychia lemnae]|eukprot:CDW73069.1 cytochrome b5-like heme steroid binding domain containing protein [Stylonychia lemnae]